MNIDMNNSSKYVYIYIYIYVCVCVCVCVYIYIYITQLIYIYIYIYIYGEIDILGYISYITIGIRSYTQEIILKYLYKPGTLIHSE